jgi:plastocyanin
MRSAVLSQGLRPAPRTLAIVATLCAALSLSACGDDGEGGARSAERSPEAVTVQIPGFDFEPDPIRIGVGDSVVWENTHDQAHTATGDGDLRWSTGNLAAGESADPVAFDEAGTFTYLCALHPFMTGTVEVTG